MLHADNALAAPGTRMLHAACCMLHAGFIAGNGAFGKVAAKCLSDGIPMTEHPALAKMFAYKYTKPESYWRLYEQWWSEHKVDYADIVTANPTGTKAFYSGPQGYDAAQAAADSAADEGGAPAAKKAKTDA